MRAALPRIDVQGWTVGSAFNVTKVDAIDRYDAGSQKVTP
jgi:hypothetical protein